MSLSFDLTASSALQALRDAADTYKRGELNAERARECAQKAWHLCDHFFHEAGPTSGFPDLRSLQDNVKRACPELGYLQDICVASKHARIMKYKPSVADTHKLDGDFCREDFDAHDFSVPRLEVTLSDGHQLLFDDLLDCAVSFWTHFFRRYGLT